MHGDHILGKKEQQTHYPLYFLARNFSDFCILETIGMIFLALKIFDGFRVIGRINVIMLTLGASGGLFSVFMAFYIFIQIALVPLAQSIWGTILIGYKTIPDCVNSVLMIAYSKGNLDVLLDINFFWSMIFLVLYYLIILFFLHASFHQVQFDALRNVVQLYSLEETDIVQEVVDKKSYTE